MSREVLQMALEARLFDDDMENYSDRLENFAHLVAAAERNQNTQLLYQMHERSADQHNYYKHAAIEINRKARSQS